MVNKSRKWVAATLAMMILFQPMISAALLPMLGSVVHAEEADDEEKEKPRPGVNNADDTGQRASSGKSDFPSGGSGSVPVYGPGSGGSNGGSSGGDGGNSITDPTGDLTPSRPNQGNGDRGGSSPDGPDGSGGSNSGQDGSGNGDADGGSGSGGDGTGNNPGDDSDGGTGGNNSGENGGSGDGDSEGGSDASDGTGSPGSDGNDASGGGDSDGGNDSSGGAGSSDSGGNGDRNGTDSDSSGGGFRDHLDQIKDNISNVNDQIKLIDIIRKIEAGGDFSAGDLTFIAGLIEISDNEDVQGFYEGLLSNTSNGKSFLDEVKTAHQIRYASNGNLSFKDYFKWSTYKDTLIGHTVDSITDSAYRAIYGEDKLALVKDGDKHKITASGPFSWLSEKVSNGFKTVTSIAGDFGSKVLSTVDRGINFLGSGFSSLADGAKSLLSKGANGLSSLKETVGNAMNNAKTSFGKTILNGVNSVVAAADRGLTSLSGVADKFGKAGQWLANSSVGKTVTNAMTNVKNFGSSMWESGKGLVSKVAQSKPITALKNFANSPLGKIGSGALSGLSIVSGITDLAGDGPWNVKVSGGLSIASGALGIAGLVAAGTAAAPILAGGALVAGVVALGFTYGPKLVNAWNESKFGSAVNNGVKTTVKAVGDAARTAGNAIAEGASNLVSNISSGISGLFGR